MTLVRGLSEALARLDRLAPASAATQALRSAAAQLEASIHSALSHHPGEEHTMPWERTGVLHDSVSTTTDGSRIVIGSDDPVAVLQELGTRTIPPRPFLATIAAASVDGIVEQVTGAVRQGGGE